MGLLTEHSWHSERFYRADPYMCVEKLIRHYEKNSKQRSEEVLRQSNPEHDELTCQSEATI